VDGQLLEGDGDIYEEKYFWACIAKPNFFMWTSDRHSTDENLRRSVLHGCFPKVGRDPGMGHARAVALYAKYLPLYEHFRRRVLCFEPDPMRVPRGARGKLYTVKDGYVAGIMTATVEAVPATKDHQIFDHVLRAGTTAGQRWSWAGRRGGETLVEIEALWTVGGEYPSHWPKPQHGWTLTIDGDPKMRTHFLVMAGSPGASMLEHVTASNVATAMQILNAVPAVCAAPPGFATMADLPLIRSATGFGND